MRPSQIGLLACTSLVAACVQKNAPLLSLGSRSCDVKPQLEKAIPVALDKTAGVAAMLGSESPCLVTGGSGEAPYAVFLLPDAPLPYTLTIFSSAMRGTLVLPLVTILDASGNVSRTVEPRDFRTNVSGLTTGLRVADHSHWLIIQADRSRLGEPVTLSLTSRQSGRYLVAAYAPVPVFIPPPYTPDIVRSREAVYALNGMVKVTAKPVQFVP